MSKNPAPKTPIHTDLPVWRKSKLYKMLHTKLPIRDASAGLNLKILARCADMSESALRVALARNSLGVVTIHNIVTTWPNDLALSDFDGFVMINAPRRGRPVSPKKSSSSGWPV